MKKGTVVASVVIILFLSWVLLSPSDEAQVQSVIDTLCELSAIDGEEHPFEGLGRAEQISAYFTEDLLVRILTKDGERDYLKNKKGLMHKVMVARRSTPYLRLRYSDLKISIRGERAIVTGTAQAIWDYDNERYGEEVPGELTLKKIDGEWRISHIKNTSPIGEEG